MLNLVLNICRSYGLFFMLLLAACSTENVRDGVKDEDSTFYAVPVGSVLVLNQELTISGNQVAIFVQNGEIKPEKDVDKYYQNCKFEIYTMSEQPRTVDSDSFEIIKVEDDIESSSLQKNTRLAVRGNTLSFGMLDRSYVFNYATMMYLYSEKQKDVYRMTCQHWEDVRDDRHLSITQMRDAMGDIFTLKIKE